jgi:hypothetical protein
VTDYESERPSRSRHDVALIVTGVLVFIAAFQPWYGVSFSGGEAEAGVTGTFNAWHGRAGAGVLLVLFSLVAAAGAPFFGEDTSPRPLAIVTSLLAVAGAALFLQQSFALPDSDIEGVSVSLRWGGWTLVVLTIVHATISVLRAVHATDGHAPPASPSA